MIWLREIAWWKKDLAARVRRTTTSSDNTDRRERWCISSTTAAAAICIAGVVVLSAAWASLRRRWSTTSPTHREQVECDVTADALVAYFRGLGSSPTAARGPPLLLLCATPESETAPLVTQVPRSAPVVSLSGLVTTGGFLSSIQPFVTMGGLSCDLPCLVAPPTPREVATPLLLLYAEAKEESVAPIALAGSTDTVAPLLLREKGGGEEASMPPVPATLPVLFLHSVLAEMASRQLPRLPGPLPVLSLSSLATADGLLSLGFPLAIGASDGVTEELSILMTPSVHVIDIPALVVCDEGNGTGALSVLQLASASSRSAQPTSSPAASIVTRARKCLGSLPSNGAPLRSSSDSSKNSLGNLSALCDVKLNNPPQTAIESEASYPPSTSPLGELSAELTTFKRHTASRKEEHEDGLSGGNGLSNPSSGTGAGRGIPVRGVDGGGGGTPATKTDASLSSLWSLPGQFRSAAPAARGRSSTCSSAWALGKSRRSSKSPEVAPRPARSRHEREASGGNGGGASRGRAAAINVGKIAATATTAMPPIMPRSILVASGSSSVSPRRAAAVARGVRWLDIAQKEEQQAKSRQQRASRWIGNGGRKRDGPQKATPRSSRAKRFALEGEGPRNGTALS